MPQPLSLSNPIRLILTIDKLDNPNYYEGMPNIDPLSIDFATLNTFIVVYELKSFSLAATKLQCNQSTISYTINRLRKVFNDPLFVRQGNSISPTLRCDELAIQLAALLKHYQQLIIAEQFNPANAQGNITFCCSYYEQSVFLTQFIKDLQLKAPGIKIKIIHSGTNALSKLKQGDCDLLISPMILEAGDLHQRKLWEDYYVCAMDHLNPLSTKTLTLDDLNQAPCAIVTYDGYWQPFYLQKLQAAGVSLNNQIELASLSHLEMTLRDSTLISLTSARLASHFSAQISSLTVPVSVTFDSHLYWSTRTHNDPMQQWLRAAIYQAAKQLVNPC